MLTNLHVKNLALIDEAEVEFGPGLNILTGETGAGKSILIGSINAALGKKISREMIRTGETSALVELVFETENPHVLELLKETDLGAEEGQVIISRKITGSRQRLPHQWRGMQYLAGKSSCVPAARHPRPA